MDSSIVKLYLTGIVLLMLCGCGKNEVCIPTAQESFDFYPTENAVWVTKAFLNSPVGTFTFIDTIRLGTDTLVETYTAFPDWYDSTTTEAELLSFQTLVVTTMTVSPDSDTTYSEPYRYGWFRQDVANMDIYVLAIEPTDGSLWNRLEFQVGQNVGDRMSVSYFYNTPYFVMEVDSVLFGNRYLRKVWFGEEGATEPSGSITQAVDLMRIVGSNLSHPTGDIQWKKFIYQSDTLLIQ